MSAYFSTSVTLNDLTWCPRKKDLASKPCPMEAMALNYLLLRFQVSSLIPFVDVLGIGPPMKNFA